VVKSANEAITDSGISGRRRRRDVLGHFNAPACRRRIHGSLVLQADPAAGSSTLHPGRERLRHPNRRGASGIRASMRGGPIRAWWSGVEQMTPPPSAEIVK